MGHFLFGGNMHNSNFFDIISSIDGPINKQDAITELSDPRLYLGSRVSILKLLDRMIEMGLLEQKSDIISVTSKGHDFYNNSELTDL